MPSRKTFAILILCASAIFSVWLVVKEQEASYSIKQKAQNTDSAVVGGRPAVDNAEYDWRKILLETEPRNEKVTNLTSNPEKFDGTTLTAQVARDFLAQYLLAKKDGGEVTQKDTDNIIESVLAVSQYTKTTGAVYAPVNVQINPKTDRATVQIYYETLNKILQKTATASDENPMAIVSQAIQTDTESELSKIDPFIKIGKEILSDLLNTSVPVDAVYLHVSLLNATSNLLTNLESMRVFFTDPVKGLNGLSEYTQHLLDLNTTLNNIRDYLNKKLY